MEFSYSPYILPLLLAAIFSGWVFVYAWQRRSAPEAAALSLMAFAITEWSLGYALEIAGTDLPTKLFWGKSQYIGITLVPLAWFIFARYHADQNNHFTVRNLLFLTAIPAITMVLAFSNDIHGLIWKTVGIERVGSFSALLVTHGAGFWVYWIYSNILLLAGTFIIGRSLKHTQDLHRRQLLAIVVGLAAPWVGNILYISGFSPIPHLDLTPFAFTITVTALALGIFGYQLVNISPIARDLIVDNMLDGMIVVNVQGSIAYINPAAGRMIGVQASHFFGKPLTDVLNPWPHLVERLHDALGVVEVRDQITVGEGKAQRWYEVRVSPFRDAQENLLGHIITIRMLRDADQKTIPLPRYVAREAIIPPEPAPAQKSKNLTPIIDWLVNFIATPIKLNLQIPPDTNPKWHQARERSFTLILRVAALLGTVALLIAPNFSKLETGLPFAFIIALIWFLGLARNIDFRLRTMMFLFLVYAMAFIETYSYGFSAASFTFFMTLVVSATLLLGRTGGLVTLLIVVSTLGAFGVAIGNGDYRPVSSQSDIPFPGTIQQALTNLLAFGASAAALIVSITILMESLNKAWQLETQALNLLQQERDLLEQRVEERTRDLADARDQALIVSRQMKKYYRAMEQSGSTIVITDANGNIEYANPRFAQSTGYTLAEAIGQNPRILKTDKQPKEYYSQLWKTISEGNVWNGEFLNKRKDGTLYWESATIAPVMDQKGMVINYVAIKEDITARRQAEDQLRKLSQAVEQSGSAVIIMDGNGKIEYVNPKFAQMSGFTFEDVFGKFPGEFFRDENSQMDFHQEEWWKVVTQGGIWHGEFNNLRKDGSAFWVFATIAPVLDHDGNISNFVEIGQDITEQKDLQESLSLARDQALEASRLKSQLLSRVSHELRTPLGSVLGYAELIRNDIYGAVNVEQAEAMTQIVHSANYLTSLVNDLLDEAQIETRNMSLNMGFFAMDGFLKQVKDRMIVLAQNKGLTFDSELSPAFPDRLYGDEKRIQQVLVNLSSNAIKFTKNGGVNVQIYQLNPSQWCMQVTDTGVGIPAEAQQDVFMPFRQLDNNITRENRGTGLGLSIVKQLVEIMGGFIELKSEVNQGSVFTVTLPIIHPKESIT